MAFTEVMMPNRPTIDRIAAYRVFEAVIGRPLKVEFVNQTISLPDSELDVLLGKGIFPIGVGLGRTYRDREINGEKFKSETAVIIRELRSVGKLHAEDKALDDFARMMDRNNDDGYLRRQPYSINWIVLQGYRLGHDSSEENFTFTDEEVIRRGAHVVEMYLRCLSGHEVDLGRRAQAMNVSAMHMLPEKARKHQGPMTVSRYIRDMFVCGLDEVEIYQRASWFVRVHDRAKERQVAADKIAETQTFDTFRLTRSGYQELATWVESDDPYLLEALVRRRSLVVMRSSMGNVILMSKDFDISRVASDLIEAEPDCWHYEAEPRNILANGTETVGVKATALSREVLEHAIGGQLDRRK